MVDPHTNGCPQPEVLAAYVDRGLSLPERARVDAHLASCPQCIALVAGVARTVEELSAHGHVAALPAEATPLVTRRSVAGALAAAAAVIAVLAAPALVRPLLERDSGLVSLVDSVGEQRSVLGRLTGGFPHAPLGVPSAGGQDGRAAGAETRRLRFGHHGANHPVQDVDLGLVQVTAQNHEVQVVGESLPAASGFRVSQINLNDRSVEGLRHDELPIETVQYHPEGAPGPLDALAVFDRFVAAARGERA